MSARLFVISLILFLLIEIALVSWGVQPVVQKSANETIRQAADICGPAINDGGAVR